MKKFLILIFCLALSVMSTAKEAKHRWYEWTGIYAGLNGGYGWGRSSYEFPPGSTGDGPDFPLFAPEIGGVFHQNVKGGLFGAHVGYNFQSCSLLLGIEGAFEGSWIQDKSVDVFAPATLPTATYKGQINWLVSLTPRLGYVYDDLLLYVKAGPAAARVKNRFHSSDVTNDGDDPINVPHHFNRKHYHMGWTGGIGVEWAVNVRWILGVEYDHYWLSKERYGGQLDPNTDWAFDYRMRPNANLILARLSYKFGHSILRPSSI